MKKITAKELTVEEKIRLLIGNGLWNTVDCNGKLPVITMSDGPCGLRKLTVHENGEREVNPSIGYPSIQVLANTWSQDCAKEMAGAIAEDCIDNNIDILLAPGVNIKRHPMNGRNFEYFSEDPYLSGTLGKAYIEGVQERGVGVCLKHFCCNNLEYYRFHQSSEVDERSLREIYYKPFEIAVEAKPISIMCSYNRINGTFASEYKKGFDYLRKECGFNGFIISDWGSVRSMLKAVKAGLDLTMPFNQELYDAFLNDYKEGHITETELDKNVNRLLEGIYKLKDWREKREHRLSIEERKRKAQEIASEGIVLLKNNGVLPLSKGVSVCVLGRYAKPGSGWQLLSGAGAAQVVWERQTFDLPARLQEELENEVEYHMSFDDCRTYNDYCINDDMLAALKKDINILCVGTGSRYEAEGRDRDTLKLNPVQVRAIRETAKVNPNTIVVVFGGGAIDMSEWEDQVAAIIYAGYPGEQGDYALADIITGKVNPSGKLTETFPRAFEDTPAAQIPPSNGCTRYIEGLDVGYRYFDRHSAGCRYPFGYGLSYSDFVYKKLTVTEKGKHNLKISYKIENRSNIEGKEVSQLYIGQVAPLAYRPIKELKRFSKDLIAAHSTKIIKFELDLSDFAYYSVSKDQWIVDDGVFHIFVGTNVNDIRLVRTVFVENGVIKLMESRFDK